ncbi:MAG: LysM peptidoglycan-binding domain-containing protein [Kofleriaceae bacterium]
MKRPLLMFALCVPSAASAQDAPGTLDPGQSGSQAPAPRPAPAPAPAAPNVVVVGSDGKVISGGDQAPAESGYYVSGDPGQVPYEEPVEVHAGPTPDLHVVRTGDTLWDICFYYFNDPWQWPKIWSYNAQITNPHWIYPGDLVRLIPRGMFAESGGIDPEAGAASAAAPTQQDPVPAPARRFEVGIKQTAFVEKSDLDKSTTIVGSTDEKELLGPGDTVYMSYPNGKPPRVGETYSIYQPGKQVSDHDKNYGSYVQVLGSMKIVRVKQDKRALGVIVSSNMEIERGAKVGPLVRTFKTVSPVAPKVDAQAPIVAMLKADQLVGQGEVVFVGLGKSSGVEVGNRMFVVRRGDALPDTMSYEVGSDDRRFPARALGEVVIVEVGEKVSIGLVTLSVQEMSVGDLVMMQKSGSAQ